MEGGKPRVDAKKRLRETLRVASRTPRGLGTLAILVIIVIALDPAIAKAATTEPTAQASSGSSENVTAPRPYETPPAPYEGVEQPVPDAFSRVYQSWDSVHSKPVESHPLLTEDAVSLRYQSSYGEFVIPKGAPQRMSMPYGGQMATLIFTVLTGASLLIPGPGIVENATGRVMTDFAGHFATEPARLVVSYPLRLNGSDQDAGTMKVTYEFNDSADKITAEFVPSAPGWYSVAWIVITGLPVVQTTDLVDTDTEFEAIASGALGCNYGGCLETNELGTMFGIGNLDSTVTLKTEPHVDRKLILDYADALGDYQGSYAAANKDFAGVAGNVALVTFAAGQLSIDPKVLATASIDYSIQRKTLFDGNSYWAFWAVPGTDNVNYAYSTDGAIWCGVTCGAGFSPFSEWLQGPVTSLPFSFTVVSFGTKLEIIWVDDGGDGGLGAKTTIWRLEGRIDNGRVAWGSFGELWHTHSPTAISQPALATFTTNGELVVTAIVGASEVWRIRYSCNESCSTYEYRVENTLTGYRVALPVAFPGPNGGVAILSATPTSALSVFAEWVSYGNPGSSVWCRTFLDWGNLGGTLPEPRDYIAAVPGFDGKIDIFASFVGGAPKKIVNYRLHPTYTLNICDWETAFVSPVFTNGNYPASHLSAGNEIGTSGEYLFWTNQTSSQDTSQRINYARIVPDFGASSEVVPWMQSSVVDRLSVALYSSRFVPIVLDSGTQLYFATHLLASDGLGPSNPWTQVAGAPLLSEVGTDVNPATGLIRRIESIFSVPTIRGRFSIASIYRQPSVFYSTSQNLVKFYRPPTEYGFIFSPVMTLDLPWIDVTGTEVVHFPGGQSHVVSWDSTCPQNQPPGWACPTFTKYYYNNTKGTSFQLVYDRTAPSASRYTLRLPDGGRYVFDDYGKIMSMYPDFKAASLGRGVSFTYTTGKLTAIVDDYVLLSGSMQRQFDIVYVGSTSRIDYITDSYGVKLVDYFYPTGPVAGCGYSGSSSGTVRIVDSIGRTTVYSICRYVLERVDFATGGRSDYTFEDANSLNLPEGSDFFSLPVRKIATYNESVAGKKARTTTFVYHTRNGDVSQAEVYTYDGLGVLKGRKDYQFRPGLGTVTTRTLDFSGQVLWYDMQTMGDPITSYCLNLLSDLSGNGNCGTMAGTSQTSGRYGDAMDFNIATSSVSKTNSVSLSLTSSFTLSAWVRWDTLSQTSGYATVVRKYDSVTNSGYLMDVVAGGGNDKKVRLGIGNGAFFPYLSAGALQTSKKWYHIAGVFDDVTNLVTLYLDGGQSGPSTGVSATPVDNSASIRVGKSDGTDATWDGVIDEVHVFNRALSANEVLSLSRTNPSAVQRGKDEFQYAPDDRVVVRTTFAGEETTPSATSEVARDDWGNEIYSRDAYGNESFASFANTNHQYAFTAPGQLKKASIGKLYSQGYDFYLDDVGPWSDGMQVLGGAPSWTLDEAAPRFSPSLKITPSSGATNIFEKTFSVSQTNVLFDAMVRFDAANTPTDTSRYFGVQVGFSTSAVLVRFNYKGEVDLGAPSNPCPSPYAATYLANTWYRLTIRVTQGGNFFYVYLDGAFLCFGQRSSPDPIARFQLQSSYTTVPFNAWIDDIRASAGEAATIQGLKDGERADLYSGRTKVDTRSSVGGSLSLNFIQGDTANPMPGTVQIRSRDDILEYSSPTSDVYGGDVISYLPPRAAEDRLVRTRTGYGYWLGNDGQSHLLVSGAIPAGARAGTESPPECGASVGIVANPWSWTAAGTPTITGSIAHGTPFESVASAHCFVQDTSHPPLWTDVPSSSEYYVQYVYFPSAWPSAQIPLGLAFRLSNGAVYKGAQWGGGITSGGDTMMGPLPARVEGWVKLIVKVTDLNYNPGTGDNKWVCNPTCETAKGIAYVLSDGQAYWDATARVASDGSDVSVTGLPTGGSTQVRVGLYYATNDSLIPGKQVTTTNGAATITLYPTISAFPLSAKIKIETCGSCPNFVTTYFSSPLTLWGGDRFEYKGLSGFYEGDAAALPSDVHNFGLGQKRFLGDCIDAVVCYDMESYTKDAGIALGSGAVTNQMMDLSGKGNHGTMGSALVYSAVTQAASGLGMAYDGGSNSYTSAGSSVSLSLSGNTMTMSGWVYPTANGAEKTVVNKEDSYQLAVRTGILQASIETTYPGTWTWGGTKTVPLNQLTQVAFVYDGNLPTGSMWAFYINGALAESMAPAGSQSGTIVPSTKTFRVGARESSTTSQFSGVIDQVAVYGRALSANEIMGLYRSRLPNAKQAFVLGDSSGLVTETREADNSRYLTTTYAYDGNGRLSTRTLNGNSTVYAHAALYGGAYPTYASRAGTTERYSYDVNNGKMLGTLTGTCDRIRTEYDAALRPTKSLSYAKSDAKVFYDMETTQIADPQTGAWWLQDMTCRYQYGTVAGAVDAPGVQGRAFAFDGVTNKVTAGTSGVSGLTSWTLSAWIFYTGQAANSYQHAVTLGTDRDVSIYVLKATGDLRIIAENSAGNPVIDTTIQALISTNRWYQVTATWDGTTLKVYLDGALKLTSTPGAISIRSESLKIGTAGIESGKFYGGRVDEVYVFDRVLTVAEISSIIGLRYQLMETTVQAFDDISALPSWAGYSFPSVTTYDGVSASRRLYLDMETTKFTVGGTTYLEDLSGNGNHIGNYGAILISDPTRCRVGNCYSFNGNQYMKLPATASLNISKELTVAAWAYLDNSADITIRQTILSRGNYLIYMQYSSGSWYLFGKVYAGGTWGQARSNAINKGVLYHVAMTFDGTAIQMYVNGIGSGASAALGGPIPTSTLSLLIGNGDETPCGVTCFAGAIDEVHILDRGFTSTEMVSFYNGYSVVGPAIRLPIANTGTTNFCGTPSDTGDWTNPASAHSNDGVYATVAPAQNANYCTEWNSFGFTIPSGVAITAVKVRVAYYVSTTSSIAELHVELQTDNGPTNCAVQELTSEPTTRTVVTFDFTLCKAWSVTDFNLNKIRAEIGGHRGDSVTAVTFYLDSVQIQVTYTYSSAATFDSMHLSRTFLDGIGRPVRQVIADGYGNKITTAQTVGWNDLTMVDFLTTGDYTTDTFDFLGRITATTTPGVAAGIAGTSYTVYYDKDRKSVSIDALGRASYQVVNLLGRTVEAGVLDPTNSGYNVTKTKYNGIGLPTSSDVFTSSGPQLWPTSYTYYDTLGRPVLEVHPDGKSAATKYDNDGRLYRRIDEMGRASTYNYDSADRIGWTNGIVQKPTESSSTSYAVDFTYDLAGYLLTVTNGTTSTNGAMVTYTYDGLHRVQSEKIDILPCSPTCVSSLTLSYLYDAAGKVTRITYPGTSKYVDYGYDPMGRPATISFGGSQFAGVSYDEYGRMFKTQMYSGGTDTGIAESFSFDARNRITQAKMSSFASTYMKLDYVYDLASQVSGITDDMYTGSGGASNAKTVTYKYDGSGRVMYAQGPFSAPETDLKISYIVGGVGYDAVGNLRRKCEYTTSCATATTYNYGSNGWGRLDTLSGSATDRFFYNDDGSMTTRDTGVGTTTTFYDFDFSQQLVKVRNSANADNSAYMYDALGRRVRTVDTVSGSPTTTYISYIGDKPAYTKQSATESWYVYVGDRVLFRYDTAAHFHGYDLSGNARILWTYSSGYVNEAKYRYKPFGEQVAVVSTTQDFRFRFGGGAEYDQAASAGGLYHMGARFSDGKLGRFLSRDPLPVHDYAYALNNPVSFVDPSGLDADWSEWDRGFVAPSGRIETGGGRSVRIGEVLNPEGEYLRTEWEPSGENKLWRETTGGREPVLKGQEGVRRTVENIEARGDTSLTTEVTIDTNGVRVRLDVSASRGPGGTGTKAFLAESKMGPSAKLSPNQRAAFRITAYEGGRPVRAVITNAVFVGAKVPPGYFTPGVTYPLVEVEIFWW